MRTPSYLKAHVSGVTLAVLVAPRAKKNKIVGAHGERLKIALSAPPVDGKANELLLRFLAETLRISARELSLLHGCTSRQKTVLIRGLDLASASRLLSGTEE